MSIIPTLLGSLFGGLSGGLQMMGQTLTGEYGMSTDKWINEQNIKFQNEANKMTMTREDNAIQRRVADLKAAGLNPILAAGQAAEAGRVLAPHMGSVRTPDFRNSGLEPILSALQAYQNISMTAEQVKLNKLQQNKVFSETVGQDLSNSINAYDFGQISQYGATSKPSAIERGIIDSMNYIRKVGGALGGAAQQLMNKIFSPSSNSFLRK